MLTQAEARERFAGASPALMPGIGPKSVERLRRQGIETLGQLADAPAAPESLRRLARFEDDRELELDRVRKSESRETTFDYDLRGVGALMPVLERLSEQLCADLERHERRGRTIGIKVRLDDFSTHTRARSVAGAGERPATRSGAWRASSCQSSTRRGRCGCSGCGWRASTRPPPPRATR